jgi:hypothetical protein
MDHEAEVIKEQMEDTRESLARKLQTLEKQVTGAVEEVTGTVEAVSSTVEKVKEAVTGTVETVTESVEETVQKVKSSLDITGHVRNHPWPWFGGSYVAGFLAGQLVRSVVPAATRRFRPRRIPTLSTLAEPPARAAEPDGWRQQGRPVEQQVTQPEPARSYEEQGKSWLGCLSDMLGPEVSKLKGLAIGTALGVVRDMITRSAPHELGAQLAEVVNNLTSRLGGEVMHEPVLPAHGDGAAGTHPSPTYAGR